MLDFKNLDKIKYVHISFILSSNIHIQQEFITLNHYVQQNVTKENLENPWIVQKINKVFIQY